jgi:uncharacterized protein YcfJ
MRTAEKVTLLVFLLSISDVAFAQAQYGQPRIVQPPRPYFNREQYQTGGAIMGGVGGLRFGGGYGAAVGAPIGGYYGGRVYDQQIAPRSYYPRYMGTQTTTPYRLGR